MSHSATKHTPTPWRAEAYAAGFYRIRGENASLNPDNGLPYFPKVAFNISEPDSAFIVRAVNAYDDLVRIAESAVSLWGFMENNLSLDKDERLAASRMAVAGRAALARAKGE